MGHGHSPATRADITASWQASARILQTFTAPPGKKTYLYKKCLAFLHDEKTQSGLRLPIQLSFTQAR